MMNKEIKGALFLAGGMLAVALCASQARKLGYVDDDTVTRVVIGLNGLMIAWYGNRLPKAFVPNAQARRARRVAGWSQVISGLIYTGLFAFAPLPVAYWGGFAAVLAGIAVTIGYCFSLKAQCRAGAA
ncbi:MAG TPA: hypothetical protein VGM81_22840 [Burkholderiaceae bacterium]|jgi:hypothetical protein